MTDVCDIEGMFRIIESIPSKNAEPIKQQLASLGKERIDIEHKLGKSIVTKQNSLNYKYNDEQNLIDVEK